MDEPVTTFRAARERTIDELCRRFADDAFSLAELERRLGRAREARSRDELDALLSDLPRGQTVPAPSSAAGVPARGAGGADAAPAEGGVGVRGGEDAAPAGGSLAARRGQGGSVPQAGALAVALMGGTRRGGIWAPPASMSAIAIMGEVVLDLRTAVLRQATTEVTCFAFWGAIRILVPETVHVDTAGLGIMGAFEHKGDPQPSPPDDAPMVRVKGLALMGGVEIEVRPVQQAIEGKGKR